MKRVYATGCTKASRMRIPHHTARPRGVIKRSGQRDPTRPGTRRATSRAAGRRPMTEQAIGPGGWSTTARQRTRPSRAEQIRCTPRSCDAERPAGRVAVEEVVGVAGGVRLRGQLARRRRRPGRGRRPRSPRRAAGAGTGPILPRESGAPRGPAPAGRGRAGPGRGGSSVIHATWGGESAGASINSGGSVGSKVKLLVNSPAGSKTTSSPPWVVTATKP